ncbi:PAS domain-containing sensor histidine kinase [Denitrobaculum tricleocarpae]|uniref:histidine kinase n=1 Tax=Denitrobaculum tricleocarpae TaxID=2591009 RepID=A0A545TR22_9PROT|nr:PAS domain-containing sensor histidine kinase [Denitrobaculum tricleocarpae]TQV79669.1 PAS domain-containing sensor histidine kinase [Denitrobaculum tricleocarpae]
MSDVRTKYSGLSQDELLQEVERLEERLRKFQEKTRDGLEAEEALWQSQQRFQDIAEIASDWFWEMDADLRFSYFSERYEAVTGIHPEKSLGKTRKELWERLPPPSPMLKFEWDQHWELLMNRQAFSNLRTQWVHADGQLHSYVISGKPLFDSAGNFAGYRGIGTDITKEVRAQEEFIAAKEEAERANRGKSEFLANMSHELRTPLNAVIGFSEVMEHELFGELGDRRYREYVGYMKNSGLHLLGIINSILDLSKIEAGKLTLYEEEINLAEVISYCFQLVVAKQEEKRIELDLQLSDDLPNLWADERLVRQILLNIGSNARKFTGNGGKVTVTTRMGDHAGHEITISDNGIGMSNADLQAALTPFGQVDSSLSRRYEGTGLGLPLSNSFIKLHGGQLEIESAPDSGTNVTVKFPAERVLKPQDPRLGMRLGEKREGV